LTSDNSATDCTKIDLSSHNVIHPNSEVRADENVAGSQRPHISAQGTFSSMHLYATEKNYQILAYRNMSRCKALIVAS